MLTIFSKSIMMLKTHKDLSLGTDSQNWGGDIYVRDGLGQRIQAWDRLLLTLLLETGTGWQGRGVGGQ